MEGNRKVIISALAIICTTLFMIFLQFKCPELVGRLAELYIGQVFLSLGAFVTGNVMEHKAKTNGGG